MVIWKKINDDYLISSTGKVYSLRTKKVLKPVILQNGYVHIYIHSKPHLLHRLVAEAFIPNPKNLPIINHKDENPQNDVVENLEWCDHKYNANYGTRNERLSRQLTGKKKTAEHAMHSAIGHMKKIYQYTKDNRLVNIWESSLEVEKHGYCRRNVLRCCRGERKTHKGYKWSFVPL